MKPINDYEGKTVTFYWPFFHMPPNQGNPPVPCPSFGEGVMQVRGTSLWLCPHQSEIYPEFDITDSLTQLSPSEGRHDYALELPEFYYDFLLRQGKIPTLKMSGDELERHLPERVPSMKSAFDDFREKWMAWRNHGCEVVTDTDA